MPTKEIGHKYWADHCPDCTHCFAGHNEESCQVQLLKKERSPSGVMRSVFCDCKNGSSDLRIWQMRQQESAILSNKG